MVEKKQHIILVLIRCLCELFFNCVLSRRYYVSISSVKVDRKWQDIGDSGHSKGSPSHNDPQSLDGRKQGGMTQSFSLAVAIACDAASTSPTSSFRFPLCEGAFPRKVGEGGDRARRNSQIVETFCRAGKLPVRLERGECTCVALVIIAIIVFAFSYPLHGEESKGTKLYSIYLESEFFVVWFYCLEIQIFLKTFSLQYNNYRIYLIAKSEIFNIQHIWRAENL